MNKSVTPAQIRFLSEDDAEIFRDLRISGLKESPGAFGADYSEWLALPVDEIAKRIRRTEDRFVLGAFTDSLVGIAGFRRREGIKVRHTGEIWGVYVNPACRGKSVGRALMVHMIDHAKFFDGLKRITLTVVAGNESARILYQSLGFYKYGTDHGSLKVNGVFLDEELMALNLASTHISAG